MPSSVRFYGLLSFGIAYLLFAEFRLRNSPAKFLVDKITLNEKGVLHFNRFVASRVFAHMSLLEPHAYFLTKD